MSIKEVTYYEVHCDEPGCGRCTETENETFGAFLSQSRAVDDWSINEGYDMGSDRHLCAKHAEPYICQKCSDVVPEPIPFTLFGGERICAECVEAIEADRSENREVTDR